ncbi:hypothetical protein BGZ60DRAFT_399409 [Tricladium varicosporioides]|nr:hypothetical protein BGZ60DRAFT_399409 [Hymenoscyphus varicosporioides]
MAVPPHPIRIPPARPLYRFFATGLSASMWFFLMYRAKKDGMLNTLDQTNCILTGLIGAVLMGWKHPWDH